MPLALLGIGAIAVVAGAVAAISGFGIGSLLTPAIALWLGTKAAVAIVAVPHAVATSVRLWGLRGSVDGGVLRTFGIASAVGGLAGALLFGLVSSPLLTVILGALLILSGLSQLSGFGARWRITGGWSIGAGLLSGVFGGLVGNQGGIRSAALLRFDLAPQALVATATATALLVDLARLPLYLATAGQEMADAWPIVLVATAGALVGTLAGVPVLRQLPEAVFRMSLAVLLLALGIGLILGATLGAGSS